MDLPQTVWVTGAGGLIGHQIVQAASKFAPNRRVVGLTREQLDLLDFPAVEKRFRDEKPRLIIHCAAMSRIAACQANPDLARKVNVEATRCLAELAAEVPFIFFSTDCVFDGRKGNYVETDQPNPLSIYAETKLEGEKVVGANPKHTIIRISLVAGRSPTGDRSFIEDMRKAWRAGETLKFFVDEFRCPIAASVIAHSIWELAAQNKSGMYHLAGSERLSRLELGKLIASLWPELNPKFEAASLRDYKGPPRAADASLNCQKIQQLLSFPLPGFSEWIRENAAELR